MEASPQHSSDDASGDRKRAGARTLLNIACLFVVMAGMRWASPILVPCALALFLTVLSLPVVFWLRSKRLPTFLAILISVSVNLGVITGIVLLSIEALGQLETELPRYFNDLKGMVADTFKFLDELGVPAANQLASEIVNTKAIVGLAQGTIHQILALAAKAFMIFLLIIFALAEATRLPSKLHYIQKNDLLTFRLRKMTLEILQYLGIKTGVSVLTGLLVWGAMSIIGVDFALIWGLLAFLLNFIPTIGSIVAAIPAVAITLIQFGAGEALLVTAIYTGINALLGNLIEPMLLGRSMGLSTLVVILSLIFWGWIWGPVGMLLAVPLTMVVRIMLEHTTDFKWIAILLAQWPAPDVPQPETQK